MDDLRLLTGNSNPKLAKDIADILRVPLVDATVSHFPDGETKVEINEDIRGKDCFVIQSTSSPVNDHLMELLVMIDALRRASAERITAVIPYFGYARQDRKHAGRVPITAKLVANLLTTAGVQRLLCLDLHSDQLQGFFDIPVDHLSAQSIIMERISSRMLDNPLILAPDAGSMKRVANYAYTMNFPIAMIDKERLGDSTVTASRIVGNIEGMDCVIIDDMISTGGSLLQAVNIAWEHGATSVNAYATHPVFSGRAMERLANLKVGELGVTDSIILGRRKPPGLNVHVLSLAPLLAEAIRRTHLNLSISYLMRKRLDEVSARESSRLEEKRARGKRTRAVRKKEEASKKVQS